MKIMLELTNLDSARGTIKSAFKDDKDVLHLYGEIGEIDFQINMETIAKEDILTIKKLEEVDEIRIWYSSINTNDSIFAAFMLHRLEEYLDIIKLIDVSKYDGKHSMMRVCVSCFSRDEIVKWQKLERKALPEDLEFARKLLAYYFSRNQTKESFIMVNGHVIYELPHEEIKDFICSHFENYHIPAHTIGAVMSEEWNEKGWIFGDNVIYKFICDLINEGRIMLHASYHERYDTAPKLFLNR